MSDNFKVCLTTIKDITAHPNAERLEYAWCYGFSVIVQKDRYKVGDEVLYVPVDSILNSKLEAFLFPSDSKIKLNNSRIRQIRIRGSFSQGLLIGKEDAKEFIKTPLILEKDYAEELGITKYEPPTPSFQGPRVLRLRDKSFSNPNFREYNGITNLKWHPDLFEGEEVVIQEKIHGSLCRSMFAPFVANTLWKKILRFLRLAPKWEYTYGSNRVELTNRKNYKGYYGEDVYGAVLKKVKAFEKLKQGECIYGELYGPGIQKGYTYGLKEHSFILFDVRVLQPDGTQKWLNPEEAEVYAKERGFDFVPVLYKGPFSKDIIQQYTSGLSVLCPSEPVREGCVVKSRYNYDQKQSKRALKSINPDYLNDPTNTDNH